MADLTLFYDPSPQLLDDGVGCIFCKAVSVDNEGALLHLSAFHSPTPFTAERQWIKYSQRRKERFDFHEHIAIPQLGVILDFLARELYFDDEP